MSPSRVCTQCRQPLSPWARADSLYCSTRCRVAAHRGRHASDDPVPAALRNRDRWLRHRAKRPITVDGRSASSTDARTWTTHEQALASRVGDGIGFVLHGDGIICVDIDNCVSGTHVASWAASMLAALPPTYIERSPSGRGLHVWGTGHLSAGRVVKVDGGKVEVYGSGRYMTVTGQRFAGAPSLLADLSATIAQITNH